MMIQAALFGLAQCDRGAIRAAGIHLFQDAELLCRVCVSANSACDFHPGRVRDDTDMEKLRRVLKKMAPGGTDGDPVRLCEPAQG
mgnify:CR=1 FL=1